MQQVSAVAFTTAAALPTPWVTPYADPVVLMRIREYLDILCRRLQRAAGLIFEEYVPEAAGSTELWTPAHGTVVNYGELPKCKFRLEHYGLGVWVLGLGVCQTVHNHMETAASQLRLSTPDA